MAPKKHRLVRVGFDPFQAEEIIRAVEIESGKAVAQGKKSQLSIDPETGAIIIRFKALGVAGRFDHDEFKLHVDATNPPARGKFKYGVSGKFTPGLDFPFHAVENEATGTVSLHGVDGPIPENGYRKNNFLRDLMEKRKTRNEKITDIIRFQTETVYTVAAKPFEPPKQTEFIDIGFSIPFDVSSMRATDAELFPENKDRRILLRGYFRLVFAIELGRVVLRIYMAGVPLTETETRILETYVWPDDIRNQLERILSKFYPVRRRPRGRAIVPVELEEVKRLVLGPKLGERHRGEPFHLKTRTWENTFVAHGVYYLYAPDESQELVKVKIPFPKVSVMQDKVTTLLASMVIEKVVLAGPTSRAEVFFKLGDILRRLGYKDADIAEGGKKYEELKSVLFTGAHTAYHVKLRKDYEYCAAFYTVERKGTSWRLRFVDRYEDGIKRVAEDPKMRATYQYQLAEIANLATSENPTYHWFYQFLLKMKVTRGTSKLMGIRKILENELKTDPDTLKRRPDCADIIARCLSFMAGTYPEDIGGAIFKETRDSKIQVRLSLDELVALEDGRDLMGKLDKIKVTDIREALLGFRHGEKLDLLPDPSDPLPEPPDLIEEILFWAKEHGLESTSEEGAEEILKTVLSLPDQSRDDLEKKLRWVFEDAKVSPEKDAHGLIFSIIKNKKHLNDLDF